MSQLSENILNLRKQNLSYTEIQKILGCSKGSISYHCGDGQKDKQKSHQREARSKFHPFQYKLRNFLSSKPSTKNTKQTRSWRQTMNNKISDFRSSDRTSNKFSIEDILNKFTEHPTCYLTGESIDIYNTESYHFDHRIPVSRGGTSDIGNLGLCTRAANQAKHDMTPEEFISFCRKVIIYNSNTSGS